MKARSVVPAADDDFDDNLGLAEAVDATIGAAKPAANNAYGQGSFYPDAQQGTGGQGQATSPGGVQPPEILNCNCGLQCSYIMAKTQKNDGRWFYRYSFQPHHAHLYILLQ